LDGLPDYLDDGLAANELPENLADEIGYIIEGDPAVHLSLGEFSMVAESGGAQLQPYEIEADAVADNAGGIFDYEILELPDSGGNYNVVVPQRQPIPENALYREYTAATGWVDFVEDGTNVLKSAPGEPGFCPAPGSDEYVDGLVAGSWCVQLTLEDGGPDDADGQINGAILHTGGVAVDAAGNNNPDASDDEATVLGNRTTPIDVLANDADVDGDTLSITSGVSNMSGDMVSVSGGYLNYSPAVDLWEPQC
jgi:hypothetical protein